MDILNILFDGKTHVREIARQLGSPDELKANLMELDAKRLVRMSKEKNRKYYSLTVKGTIASLTIDKSELGELIKRLTKILPRLELIASGRLILKGGMEIYVTKSGEVMKILRFDEKKNRMVVLQDRSSREKGSVN